MKIEELNIKIQEIANKNNINPYAALIKLFNLANKINDSEIYNKKNVFSIKERKLAEAFLKLRRIPNGMNRAKKNEASSVFNVFIENISLTKWIEKKDEKTKNWVKVWVNSHLNSLMVISQK